MLTDFAQQLRCKNADVPEVYVSSVDADGKSQLWFWIKKRNPER